MTLMEFAGRLGNHIAAFAVGQGCEIDSYSVNRDAQGNLIVRVARRELGGTQTVHKMFSSNHTAQMNESARGWMFSSEAERIVALLLSGEGELT